MEDWQLVALAVKYGGNYHNIYQAIKDKEDINPLSYKVDYITINDLLYPEEFKSLRFPPFVLFYQGNINLLTKRKIAIVGSRNYSEYGAMITKKIVNKLSGSWVIVSGMAKGIDKIAHQQANQLGNSIGVLGCGIDRIYPKENSELYKDMRNNQLLISEYPQDILPRRYHFPFRNRLIAALGESLIVTEAGMQSGTMLTVNEAIELNKEVYVVPHPLTDQESGCNYLIKQGANVLTCIEDIEQLGDMFDKSTKIHY